MDIMLIRLLLTLKLNNLVIDNAIYYMGERINITSNQSWISVLSKSTKCHKINDI